MLHYNSLRLLLAMITAHDLCVYQMDVDNVYLEGTLKEEFYIWGLEGLNDPNKCAVCFGAFMTQSSQDEYGIGPLPIPSRA